jgi:hypothetical protein
VLALAGCGGIRPSPSRGSSTGRSAVVLYMAQVEPLRLAVNRLLEGADPILAALREHRLGATTAAARMHALERRFAAHASAVAAIRPRAQPLRSLHARYAATYVLEDAYLSALAAAIADHGLGGLPDTQSRQRAAIIRWRIGVTALAARTGAALPSDLQHAGRGEIAPSPTGS